MPKKLNNNQNSVFNSFRKASKNLGYFTIQRQLGNMQIAKYCDYDIQKIKKFLKGRTPPEIYGTVICNFESLIQLLDYDKTK